MKSKFIIYLCISLIIPLILSKEPNSEIIDLNDPDGNKPPSPNDEKIIYIPILHTNDIHGSFYPKKILLPDNENFYYLGGLEYMGKYASIMEKEWGDSLVYFDTGDQFQGGLEAYISNGDIIMDFFNYLEVEKAVVGNHEFDFGFPYVKRYMNTANFTWIIDNIKNLTTGLYKTFPKQEKSMIIYVGPEKIKLGIIGLVTQETPASSNTKMDDLLFDDYVKIINEESRKLKAAGAEAIIVIGHLGLYCRYDTDEVKLTYRLRTNETQQEGCRETDEAYKLLHKLKPGVIDLFLAGHRHDVTHHWVNGFPVMSNDRNGKYAQIVYLPFDRETRKLINKDILMEGPLPICEKIFKERKICDLSVVTDDDYQNYGELCNYNFHNVLIEKDENITKIAEKYIDQFNEYDKDVLTFTKEHLESSKEKETSLGNFYCDFLRHISGVDIALVNPGAFRTPFYRGNITNATVYSFDPFGNDLVKFKAYGKDVIRMFKQLQAGSKGFYPFSGLKQVVMAKPTRKLLSIKLWDGLNEEEIDENKLYTLASNDFCFPLEEDEVGGDDFEKIYQWFRPIDGEYISIDGKTNSRDILINYFRTIDELKGEKYYDKNNLRMRVINPVENDD